MLPFMARRSRQLALNLRAARRWGGLREGAGRKPRAVRRDPHLLRAPLASRHPCHVTLKVRRDVPSLRTVAFVREFERSLRIACERGRFRVVHYSLQGNHAHLIVEAASARDLSCGLKSVAARLARAANRVFHRSGAVLSDRCHVRVLRYPREVRNAIAYVLCNARRHLAKLGRRIDPRGRIDPASSGRWFDGWRRDASVRAHDPPAVAVARTWLLGLGWRRAGLVDSAEVPGGALVRAKGDRHGFERSDSHVAGFSTTTPSPVAV